MKYKKELFIYGFCLLISVLILLFTSQNSPFYPMNDWVDVNAFFTVGKGMIRGLVPYKDLFEQKGPMLYLIYGIGYLISNHSFLGVFIIESIFNSIFLYYSYKIIKLFIDERYSFIILPILFTVITTSNSFCHGGSAEELCFPFLTISLYHLLNYFLKKKLNSKTIWINGLLAGIVFLIKFNLCGFWFAWMMFVFVDLCIKKEWKKGIHYCWIFLGGMFLPFLLFSFYFLIHHSFQDFIHTYFIINTTMYGNTSNILIKVVRAGSIFINNILNRNNIIIFALFMGIIYFIEHMIKETKIKLYLYTTILISIVVTFMGGKSYIYYSLIWFPFTIFTWIELFRIGNNLFPKFKNTKTFGILCIFTMISCLGIAYKMANYNFLLFKSKKDMAQYEYANIIKKQKDRSLLNYGFLDLGFYFTTDQDPTIKHFEIQNIDYKIYPENIDTQKKCIQEKCVNYVVMATKNNEQELQETETELLKNYQIIATKKQFQDYEKKNFYLLKRR